jgi:hypothetical protein
MVQGHDDRVQIHRGHSVGRSPQCSPDRCLVAGPNAEQRGHRAEQAIEVVRGRE